MENVLEKKTAPYGAAFLTFSKTLMLKIFQFLRSVFQLTIKII